MFEWAQTFVVLDEGASDHRDGAGLLKDTLDEAFELQIVGLGWVAAVDFDADLKINGN